jgi:KAP family P-loop domain
MYTTKWFRRSGINKKFFDIEGIIYVVGMNHATIDSLIEEKYKSKKKTVTGLDYMKKIVQVPFHIPEWSREDIRTLVSDTIDRVFGPGDLQTEYTQAFDIIIQAIDANPREAKRFINSVILSRAAFSNLPLDELMVVHALRFRTEWNPFLDFVTETSERKKFFNTYETLVKSGRASAETIDSMANSLEEVYISKLEMSTFEEQRHFADANRLEFSDYYKNAKGLLQLWPNIEIEYPGFLLIHNPLNSFLLTIFKGKTIKDRLRDVEDLERFRRASRTTSDNLKS